MINGYQRLIKKSENDLFIIGEVGVNHEGSIKTAKQLIDVAKEAGCDAVKFQTWITEKVYSKQMSIKPEYQKMSTDPLEAEFDTIKKLELSFEAFKELKNYCVKKDILFCSTPDEQDSTDFLIDLGIPLIKTSSQDVTNLPFLEYLAKKKLPLIFSTGACTLEEMVEGIQKINRYNKKLIILHCISSYPAPLEEMNLKFISVLKQMFPYPIGLSDHTKGIEAACASVALGARIFEKHFTLDSSTKGPDHKASLNPKDLKKYVKLLRSVYKALGDGYKKIMPCEVNIRKSFQRFLVSAREIPEGDVFSETDFVFKKITKGIEPKYLNLIVGKHALVNIPADTPIKWNTISP